ncbi:MAG: hypothetical protein OXB89_04090 [Anaerolineaceae bacterium]|nr:hypothetical protein [Anaerolineaceae bacterium]
MEGTALVPGDEMGTEDRIHSLEQEYRAVMHAIGELKGELRWIRYIMLAILAVLLKNTFWP